jgi:hypothetical protein
MGLNETLTSIEAKILGVISGILVILVAVGVLAPDLQAPVMDNAKVFFDALIVVIGAFWSIVLLFKKPVPVAQGVKNYQDWLDRLKSKKTTIISLFSIIAMVLAWFKLIPEDSNFMELVNMGWDNVLIILTVIGSIIGLFTKDEETILG